MAECSDAEILWTICQLHSAKQHQNSPLVPAKLAAIAAGQCIWEIPPFFLTTNAAYFGIMCPSGADRRYLVCTDTHPPIKGSE